MSRPVASRPSGFTLLEVLVAMAVMAVFSVLAYQGLSRMVDGSAALKAATTRSDQVARAMEWLDETCSRSLQLRLPPAPPVAGSDPDPAGFIAEIWRPVADPASPPQRAVLFLEENRLMVRLDSVGTPPEAEPAVLLERVAAAGVRALDASLHPVSPWPPSGSAPTLLPQALEVSLSLADGTRYRRVFVPR